MAYEIVLNEKNKTIEIHSDLCDELLKQKDDFIFNNEVMYINFHLFEEVEEFLSKHEDYEVIFCEICKPDEKRYDEEYDDFYEEFSEDDEIDDSRCDII